MNLEAQQKWYNKEKRDYFNMYGYRISVFEVLWKNQVIRFLLIFLALFYFYLFFQRVKTSLKSGGSMFDPFHIAKGRLYIHTIILFRKRIVPLAEIRQIDIDYVRGRRMNGDRYHLYFTRKDGKSFTFHFGKSKRNEELLKNLANVAKKCHIKIYYYY